jgi:hypothetical protein
LLRKREFIGAIMIYQKRELLAKTTQMNNICIWGKWFNITKFEYDNRLGQLGDDYRTLKEI